MVHKSNEKSFFNLLKESIETKIDLKEKVGEIFLSVPHRINDPYRNDILTGINSTVAYLKQKITLDGIETEDFFDQEMTPEYISEVIIQASIAFVRYFPKLKSPKHRTDLGSKRIYVKILFGVLTLFLNNAAQVPRPTQEFENQIKEINSLIKLHSEKAEGTA